MKFLAHLRLQDLKSIILSVAPAAGADDAEDASKNEEAYAVLIQLLDDKSHILELANGERATWIALKEGTAEVRMRDSKGRDMDLMLKQALYVPSFSQVIFSVKAATAQRVTVIFKEGQNRLIHKNGTSFNINIQDRLSLTESETDQCSVCYDVQTRHQILGHCNYDDVLKLESVTGGMKIKGQNEKSDLKCEVRIKGKFAESRNRDPDEKTKDVLDLVHGDLAGPTEPAGKDSFRFALGSTDDYSGAMFTYFQKFKSDTIEATERFIADVTPYGKIK